MFYLCLVAEKSKESNRNTETKKSVEFYILSVLFIYFKLVHFVCFISVSCLENKGKYAF